MEINIGQYGTKDRPLGRPHDGVLDLVKFKVSSAKGFSDQSRKLSVPYLVLYELHEDLMAKAVKALGDIALEVVRRRTKLSFHLPNGSVTAPFGAETMAICRESGFKNDFQNHSNHFLNNFIPRGSHSQWSHLPITFWNHNPYSGLKLERFIRYSLDGIVYPL